MAQLAIKGHPTRGKEVIQLLEILGGKSGKCWYTSDDNIYFINTKGFISATSINNSIEYIVYTLEEFEEKFPYKVGDKVYNIIHNENQTITEVTWDFQEDEIVYQTNNNDYLFVNYLQPYEEENYCQVIGNNTSSNGVNTSVSSINEETMKEPEPKAPILSNRYDYAEGKCGYVIPDGYEFDCIKEGFQTEIILKPKKPQYPKYYEECYKIMKIHSSYECAYNQNLLNKINNFYKLLLCRDAYWKIAGEQLGLGKPWEPDCTDDTLKYGIRTYRNKINCNYTFERNGLLLFPTEEMQNEFYKNFRELIEQCKELL